MIVDQVITQLRTTNLQRSIEFYVARLGFTLDFQYQDFYAGIRVSEQHAFHLKLVDERDPSIEFVASGGHFHLFLITPDAESWAAYLREQRVEFVSDLQGTAWGTREFYIRDDEGHILCFSEATNP